MRECRSIVPKEVYQTLVKRVNEAEKEHGDDDAALLLAAAGLQVRECPKCRTKIEKNKGCDQMDCYLCGEHFTWGKAHKVQKPSAAAKPAVPQPAAAPARARGGRVPPGRSRDLPRRRNAEPAPRRMQGRSITSAQAAQAAARLSARPARSAAPAPAPRPAAASVSRAAIARLSAARRPRTSPARHAPSAAVTADDDDDDDDDDEEYDFQAQQEAMARLCVSRRSPSPPSPCWERDLARKARAKERRESAAAAVAGVRVVERRHSVAESGDAATREQARRRGSKQLRMSRLYD